MKCSDFGFANNFGTENAANCADLFYKRFEDEVLLIAENSLVLSLRNMKTFDAERLE